MSSLSESILGGFRQQDDRGAPAIDVKGVTLVSVNMIQSGTYSDEFLRPYIVSATNQDLDEISDIVCQAGQAVNTNDLAGVAGRMLRYNNRVTDRDLVNIEGGWDEPRFSFILEVIEQNRDEDGRYLGRETVTYISGYTNCLDIADRGRDIYMSPETVFYVSNLRRVERSGMVMANTQLLVPEYYRDNRYRVERNGLFTLRPSDVMSNESINHNFSCDNDDIPVVNSVADFAGSMLRTSRTANLNASTYLSSTINALRAGETNKSAHKDAFGSYTGRVSRDDSYNKAKAYLQEERPNQANGFLQVLRQNTQFNNSQTFTWGEMRSLFGADALESITDIHTLKRAVRDARVSERGETAEWDESENGGQNAVIATVLKQVLPAYALESLIYSCRIDATNMLSNRDLEDSVGGFRVEVSDVLFAGSFSEAYQDDLIRDFEDTIALQILKDVSMNNAIGMDIVVELDWRFDTFIDVGIEGGRMIKFSSAGFAGSLTSPIITANRDTVYDIGHDIKSIISSALGR